MRPRIFLNHAYVVAGPKIFNAMQNSAFFMQRFARVDHKTFTSPTLPAPWTGLYMRGRQTYLEIFSEFHGRKVGDYGFGFGVERIGDLEKIYPAIKAAYPSATMGNFQQPVAEVSSRTKDCKEEFFTSFKYILLPKIPSATSAEHIDTFIMEYVPESFKVRDLPSTSNQPKQDISRLRYNSKMWDSNAHLDDIVSLTVALEPEVCHSFSRVLGAFLARKMESSKQSDDKISFQGEGFDIHLKSVKNVKPLNYTIHMTLLKPVSEPVVHPLDQARLALEQDKATLNFAP